MSHFDVSMLQKQENNNTTLMSKKLNNKIEKEKYK